MDVTFLKAQVPLRKRFDEHGKHSYPSASTFTSFTVGAETLKDLTYLIKTQAEVGNCLLKGVVTRELENESRAGTTNRDAPTSLICLDADGLTGVSDVTAFLSRLGLSGYSFILQHSSSSFLSLEGRVDESFNAHVFIKLSEPVSPHLLKLWLKQKNFDCFVDDLVLTASDMALRWGLDITTCQNDKLLYIASPDVHPPYEDTLKEDRITYHEGEKDEVQPAILGLDSLDPEKIKKQEFDIINQRRLSKGLDKKRATSFVLKGTNVEYLANPSKATITDVKEDRGFVYFNLNGGNSWAYFHPADNIEYIFNFKGEPTYRTEELLPSYYHKMAKQLGIEKAGGREPIAFRGLQDGAVYNGFWDTGKNEVELHMARRPADALLFLKEYNIELEALPTYRLLHEPHQEGPRVDIENKTINLFTRSKLERDCEPSSLPTPVIDRVLLHVLGSTENVRHFMNWLAFVVQYKRASGTSWVLHGSQGTGKGILFNRVLRHLLGFDNTIQLRTANFEDSYNGFLENTLLANVDEVDVPDSRKEKTIAADMKNYMTEPTIAIRKMYANVYTVPNLVNFIFSSNKRNPVPVERTDRRFNIANYQEDPIQITEDEIEDIADELNAFMYQMLIYPVDQRKAQTAIINQAKLDMQALSETSVDQIATALTKGQASILYEFCEDDSEVMDIEQKALIQKYNTLVKEIVCDGRDRFTRHDLKTIFAATVGKVPPTPAKFTKYLKHHGIEVGLNRIDGEVHRGSLVVEWQDSEEWFTRTRREYGVMKTVKELGNEQKNTDPSKVDRAIH